VEVGDPDGWDNAENYIVVSRYGHDIKIDDFIADGARRGLAVWWARAEPPAAWDALPSHIIVLSNHDSPK